MDQEPFNEEIMREESIGVFKGLIDHLGVAAVRAHMNAGLEAQKEGLSGGIVIPDHQDECYVLIGPKRVRFHLGNWLGYSITFEEAQEALEEVAAEGTAA